MHMTTEQHPLGNVNGTAVDAKSIVDQVLDLDEFLAAEVRLAVRQAAFYTRGDLEASIDELNAELNSLTDSQGRPLPVLDGDLEAARPARVVASELLEVQKEYAASRRVILMQQLDQDDWAAFQQRWKEELTKNPPYAAEFYEDLITRSAMKPKITVEQLRALRKKLGAPAFDELWQSAWGVNTQSGVSIPKSLLSSDVLRQSPLG
jgi:hypothetical protein